MGILLQGVLAAIHSLVSINKLSNREKRLQALHPAIAQIDALIQSHAQSMDPIDLRVLATWKLNSKTFDARFWMLGFPTVSAIQL